MYEMQGPGPVFGRWPAGCPAGVLVNRPAAGTGYPREVPVSRFFLRSGVAPGVVPVSGSDVFLLPGTPVAQGFRALISRFFRCPQNVHSDGHVVPRSRHFSTGPSTTFSTPGWLSLAGKMMSAPRPDLHSAQGHPRTQPVSALGRHLGCRASTGKSGARRR